MSVLSRRKMSIALEFVWFAVFAIVFAGCATQSTAEQNTLRKATVRRGTIDEYVTATGAVYPEERSSLSFEQTGYVTEVNVVVGSRVKAGDVLARVRSASLDLAVSQAELRLKAVQLSYDQLFEPPSKAQVAGAQAAVANAIAAYNKLTEPPDPEDVRVAQYEYEQAYEAYLKNDKTGIAVANLESARLKLEQLTEPPNKNAVAAASAAIAQAQAQLDAIRQGPNDATIARAKNQIDQAQLTLDRVRRQRDGATLIASYDGVVSVVNIDPGTLAPASLPAIVLVDISHLHVEIDVDEVDIAGVAVGQPALVRFDALPNQEIQGQVTKVSPTSSRSAGVVTYSVRVDLAPTELPIRSGMTATADIVVQRVAEVLLVPNWAIRVDPSTGLAFASVLNSDDRLSDVPVLLGIRSTDESQVLGGLQEGQTVAVSLGPDVFSPTDDQDAVEGE